MKSVKYAYRCSTNATCLLWWWVFLIFLSNICNLMYFYFQIHHAKGLPMLPGGQEPNTYVKCYLKPDPSKVTKRKTKVVRKTCVPSFMETVSKHVILMREPYNNERIIPSSWSTACHWKWCNNDDCRLLSGHTIRCRRMSCLAALNWICRNTIYDRRWSIGIA